MIHRVDKGPCLSGSRTGPTFKAKRSPASTVESPASVVFQGTNDALANQLLGEQLEDGGWNCEAPKSRRSLFHTTIRVLEGLLEYERAGRKSAGVTKARKRAEDYLLERRMFRSLLTAMRIINTASATFCSQQQPKASVLTKCNIRYSLNSSWTPKRLNGPWKAAGCGALRSAML